MTTKDVNAAIWKIEAPEAVKRGILGPMYTRTLGSLIRAKLAIDDAIERMIRSVSP